MSFPVFQKKIIPNLLNPYQKKHKPNKLLPENAQLLTNIPIYLKKYPIQAQKSPILAKNNQLQLNFSPEIHSFPKNTQF